MMKAIFEYSWEIIIPIFLIVGSFVAIVTFVVWLIPFNTVKKHANNIYCETTKPSMSFNETETCFQYK